MTYLCRSEFHISEEHGERPIPASCGFTHEGIYALGCLFTGNFYYQINFFLNILVPDTPFSERTKMLIVTPLNRLTDI
jgi:hypothetical protein